MAAPDPLPEITKPLATREPSIHGPRPMANGLVLIYKVLEHGSFAWPKVQDGVMRLSRAQFEALFEGLDWRRVMPQRVLPPSAAG